MKQIIDYGPPAVAVVPSLCDQWAALQERIEGIREEIEWENSEERNVKTLDRLHRNLREAKKELKQVTEKLAELERSAPDWAKLPGKDFTQCDDSDPNAKAADTTARPWRVFPPEASSSRFFPLEAHPPAEPVGIRCSLNGVLQRAANACQQGKGNGYLAHPLRQLNEHIELLRVAQSDAEAAELLSKFLHLWVKG